MIVVISKELSMTFLMLGSKSSGHCDVISNRLWRHQQNVNWASETRGRCMQIAVSSSFMDSLCHVENIVLYVLSRWTVYAVTRAQSMEKHRLVVNTFIPTHRLTIHWTNNHNCWCGGARKKRKWQTCKYLALSNVFGITPIFKTNLVPERVSF